MKLDGAVYELRRTSDGKLMKEITVKDGNATVQGFYLDDYYWIETKAPEGYEPAKDFKVTIREQNETHNYAIENKVIEEKLKVVFEKSLLEINHHPSRI